MSQTEPIEVAMEFEQDKIHSVRYKAMYPEGTPIKTLYLMREAYPDGMPQAITVTVTRRDGQA